MRGAARTVVIFLSVAITASVLVGVAQLRSCREELYYKNRVARLQGTLEEHHSVERIQGWLAAAGAQHPPPSDRIPGPEVRNAWPECIRELRPFRVDVLQAGGVSVQWYHGDLLAVDIFPPGRRPFREPRDDYYGYHASYGADAYIWMIFK